MFTIIIIITIIIFKIIEAMANINWIELIKITRKVIKYYDFSKVWSNLVIKDFRVDEII